MSSRAGMIGSGSSSGNYKPSPTPTEQESMPTYINDELLTVGGIVNGILEGGAFPPQGEMPVRWREGMMMYFIEPLDDTYIKGELKGQKIITSAGIWLYRRERWWKIVDDPSNIVGVVFAYKLTSDGSPPSTPNPSSYPPDNWDETAPTKSDKSEWIWITMSSAFDENTDTHTWTQPTPFSAGVTDGQDGLDGAPGEPGEPGLDGTNGENGYRGTVVLTDTVARTSWSSTAAYNLVVNTVSGDVDAKNRVPLQGDVVTQQSSAAGFVETRRYVGNSGNPGTWQVVDLVVDGNAVVTGTLNGNALIANTQIRIGGNSGQDVVVLDANDSNARIYVGAANGSTARNTTFAVTPDGTLYANNGFFNGTLVGNIGSNGGHLEGSAISVPTIASPKFHVDSAGNMTCTDARITGDITGSSGTFNGDIYAENIIGGVTSSFVKPLPVFSTTVNANTWVDVATINITNTYPFDRSLSITGLENGLIRVHVQSAASGGTNYQWRLYSPSLNKTYYIISGTATFPSGTPPVYTYISQNRFFAMIPANEAVGDMVLQWRSTTANNLVVRGNSDNNDTFSYNGLYTLLKDNAEMT